jgi:hypothetical protein
MMANLPEMHDLTLGLQGLAVLARHAPVDVAHFARLNRLSLHQAMQFMKVYEAHGYAVGIDFPVVYIPTALTMNLVAGNSSTGPGAGAGALN